MTTELATLPCIGPDCSRRMKSKNGRRTITPSRGTAELLAQWIDILAAAGREMRGQIGCAKRRLVPHHVPRSGWYRI